MTDIIGYIASFLFVLALIGVCAWLMKRFLIEGQGRVGGLRFRPREARLKIVEGASVDGRRRLILVRRDDVEHLILTGGPNDIVVESGIQAPQSELAEDDGVSK